MAFIGESRIDADIPWQAVVCLDKDDCALIEGAVRRQLGIIEKRVERHRDIIEGGEATNRQQTVYMNAVDKLESLREIYRCIREKQHKEINLSDIL